MDDDTQQANDDHQFTDPLHLFSKERELEDSDLDSDYGDFEEPEKMQVTKDELVSASKVEQMSTNDDSSNNNASASAFAAEFKSPHSEVVADLNPFEVRWFYKNPKDKKWKPFKGYDSCRIEWKYRAYMKGKQEKTYSDENDVMLVQGGLYEADVASMKCLPVYWDSSVGCTDIMRGTWFYSRSWQPVPQQLSDSLEAEHLKYFKGVPINPPHEDLDKLPHTKKVVLSKQLDNLQIDWFSPTDIVAYNKSTTSKLLHSIQSKIGMAKSGNELSRGYRSEARPEERETEVTHLVFVIHGIGQKYNKGSIITNTTSIREISQRLSRDYLPELEKTNRRVEFLPVEWRTSLVLDEDVVDSITPVRIRGLREMLNNVGLDILYYTSPHYRHDIVHGLQREMNSLYLRFVERNPYFEAGGGKVSLLAHSLGSVIIYDIITGWNPGHAQDTFVMKQLEEEVSEMGDDLQNIYSELETLRDRASELEAQLLSRTKRKHLVKPSLKFKVENLFMIGSPLAVFLALRGVRPRGEGRQEDLLPRHLCNRIYNVYHPSDPIAYRLEPLIMKHYSGIKPVQIAPLDLVPDNDYSQTNEVAYGVSDGTQDKNMAEATCAENQATKKQGIASTLGQMFSKFSGSRGSGGVVSGVSEMKDASTNGSSPRGGSPWRPSSPWKQTDRPNESNVDKTVLEHRLDFQLKMGQLLNQYWSAVGAHTSYWSSADSVMFLLQHIFPGIQAQRPPSQRKKSSKGEGSTAAEESSGSSRASSPLTVTVTQ